MTKAYELAEQVDNTIVAHLEYLEFPLGNRPLELDTWRKIHLLNYLRTIRTTCEVLEHTIQQTPVTKEMAE